jgi:hypothetical protein
MCVILHEPVANTPGKYQVWEKVPLGTEGKIYGGMANQADNDDEPQNKEPNNCELIAFQTRNRTWCSVLVSLTEMRAGDEVLWDYKREFGNLNQEYPMASSGRHEDHAGPRRSLSYFDQNDPGSSSGNAGSSAARAAGNRSGTAGSSAAAGANSRPAQAQSTATCAEEDDKTYWGKWYGTACLVSTDDDVAFLNHVQAAAHAQGFKIVRSRTETMPNTDLSVAKTWTFRCSAVPNPCTWRLVCSKMRNGGVWHCNRAYKTGKGTCLVHNGNKVTPSPYCEIPEVSAKIATAQLRASVPKELMSAARGISARNKKALIERCTGTQFSRTAVESIFRAVAAADRDLPANALRPFHILDALNEVLMLMMPGSLLETMWDFEPVDVPEELATQTSMNPNDDPGGLAVSGMLPDNNLFSHIPYFAWWLAGLMYFEHHVTVLGPAVQYAVLAGVAIMQVDGGHIKGPGPLYGWRILAVVMKTGKQVLCHCIPGCGPPVTGFAC